MKIFNKNNSGFTLIELLVVVAIIGLLSSVVLASLNTARAKARDVKRMSDLKQIQTALELYANDHNGQYPYDPSAPGWRGGNCTTNLSGSPFPSSGPNGWIPDLAPKYIPILPLDSKPGGMYVCYIYNSNATDYVVFAYWTLETYATPSSIPVAFRYSSRPAEILFAIYSAGASSGW